MKYIRQWRAGYYFSGGPVGYQSIMRPYNVTLGERRPKDRGERHKCEVVLGGPGACSYGNFLKLESLKCHFLDFGGRFDRNQRLRKRNYNVSKLAIWSIRRPLFLFAPPKLPTGGGGGLPARHCIRGLDTHICLNQNYVQNVTM